MPILIGVAGLLTLIWVLKPLVAEELSATFGIRGATSG